MSMKNILVLTVLMYFGLHDVIQAEVIHGMDIPTLDKSRTVGNWYALASPLDFEEIGCTTLIIEQHASDNFTMIITTTPTPAESQRHPNLRLDSLSRSFFCTPKNDSNSLICNITPEESVTVAVFDADYDSYMALYVKNSKDEMDNRNNAFVIIVSRQPILPDDLIEKVKQSSIYQQGINHDITELITMNISNCH